ncbi:hypothetical protein [Bacillus sp. 2SH]|uniref:hypothetical protein n=1 Tax=Bacillus sp. 2SH TaxID=2502202 RepID=UPI0010F8D255|nr:hypothetical protein [Bacillus sp. 2SH]
MFKDIQDTQDKFGYARGSVNPRTCSYNFVLPIIKIIGNRNRGPNLQLNLSYNTFSKENEGFGIGWSLGLSKFIKKTKNTGILYLRDGRAIDITINQNQQPTIHTVGILDFQLYFNLAQNYYQIRYKDGTLERLDILQEEDNSEIYYLKRLTNEAGYTLYFEYSTSEAGIIYLQKIIDMYKKNYVEFALNSNTLTMDSFPDSEEFKTQFHMFFDKDNRLSYCSALNIENHEYSFSYNKIEDFLLLSQVENQNKFKEKITYSDTSVKLLQNSPYKKIPTVDNYEITMYAPDLDGIKERKQKHIYYCGDVHKGGNDSDTNFTGYAPGEKWQLGVADNIYLRSNSYQYSTTEQVYVDGTNIHEILRTYNKYHLLINEKFSASISMDDGKSRTINNEYTYYADVTKKYEDQVPQYQLLKKKTTQYIENTSQSKEDFNYKYDKYGNILEEEHVGIQRITYEYIEEIPFVRFLNKSTEYTKGQENSYQTEYNYIKIPGINKNSYFNLLERIKENIVINKFVIQNKEIEYKYYQDIENSAMNGLIKEKIVTLIGAVRKNNTYEKVPPHRIEKETFTYDMNDTIIKASREKEVFGGTDTETISDEIITSFWNNLVLLEKPLIGVQKKYEYDRLGRIQSVTSGYLCNDTTEVLKTSYEYEDTTTNGFIIREITPEKKIISTHCDGFGNETIIKIQQKVAKKMSYNTLNQLLEEHIYDYDVNSSEGNTPIDTEIVKKYSYDAFGRLKETHSNGIVYKQNYDMVKSELTEYVELNKGDQDSNKKVTKYNESGKTIWEKYYIDNQMVKYISCDYDEFNNLIKEVMSIPDISEKTLETEYEYDVFGRVTVVTESEQDSTNKRRTEYNYSFYTDEPLQTEIYVNNKLIGKRTYDNFNRLLEEKIGDNNPKKYTYEEGYFEPNKITTPTGEELKLKYREDLDFLLSEIESDGV